jgi:BRCT domain type II-containing protein
MLSWEFGMSDKQRVYVTEWLASISDRLDLLIYGEKASPKKIQKVRPLEIKLLSWSEFLATVS